MLIKEILFANLEPICDHNVMKIGCDGKFVCIKKRLIESWTESSLSFVPIYWTVMSSYSR